MKLLIVGLDGLDPDLVGRWEMGWFQQKTWGRHYVGFLSILNTAVIWSCFLTGLNVEKLGYDFRSAVYKKYEDGFRFGVLRTLYRLKRKLAIGRLGLRRLMVSLGLFNPVSGYRMPEHLLEKSFLEELKAKGYRVAAIEVPGYNESKNEYYRSSVAKLVAAPFSERLKLIDEAMKDVEERAHKVMKHVREGYELVMVYSPLPDIAFHLTPKPRISARLWLRTLHYRLYKTVEPLLKLAEKEGYATLIVSDHGFDLSKYDHSSYGFWSLSVEAPTWWNICTVLDFKKNILKLVERG